MQQGSRTILVVDDERSSRAIVVNKLSAAGMRVIEAANGRDGWEQFRTHQPDLVVSDLRMDGLDGLHLLGLVRGASTAPFVMMSSFGDIDCAVEAMKNGAQDFVEFPKGVHSLVETVRSLLPEGRSGDWIVNQLRSALPGASSATRDLRHLLARLCGIDPACVVVEGEPGSGRDHVIRTLHEILSGADPLEIVDCRSGVARSMPKSGAIYFDEIAALSSADQGFVASLIERAESPASIGNETRVRICASATQDVRTLGLEPRLLRHLERVRISLPTLEERKSDIPVIAEALCLQVSKSLGTDIGLRISPAGLTLLSEFEWKGHVREMMVVLERAAMSSSSPMLSAETIESALDYMTPPRPSPRQKKDLEQKRELQDLIIETGCNVSEISRRLDLSRGAIYYRASKFGLEIS